MAKKNRNLTTSDVVEILDWLEKAEIKVWLDGGWGHDAVLREQTRQHDDLDLVGDVADSSKLEEVLTEKRFKVTERESTNALVFTDSSDRQVDVHLARFDETGKGLYRMSNGEDWVFSPESLQGEGAIGERTVRCMTPEFQMLCKTGDFEPTENDYQDVTLLHERFGVEIPEMYQTKH